jgi:hypothetical protein
MERSGIAVRCSALLGDLREIPIDFFSMEASHERYRVTLNYDPDSIFSNSDTVVVSPSLQFLQIRNLRQVLGLLYLLNSFLDAL